MQVTFKSSANGQGLTIWVLEYHQPVTEAKFINKSSVFILLVNVIRHAGTTDDAPKLNAAL
jgi:hypothetical protein